MQINIHPVNHLIMGKLENELIDDAVNAFSSTNQFQLGVRGVIKDKVVLVEMREGYTADTAGHLECRGQFPLLYIFRLSESTHSWYMINVRFLDHSTHSMFH